MLCDRAENVMLLVVPFFLHFYFLFSVLIILLGKREVDQLKSISRQSLIAQTRLVDVQLANCPPFVFFPFLFSCFFVLVLTVRLLLRSSPPSVISIWLTTWSECEGPHCAAECLRFQNNTIIFSRCSGVSPPGWHFSSCVIKENCYLAEKINVSFKLWFYVGLCVKTDGLFG